MKQTDLFDFAVGPMVRRDDHDTSIDAAASVNVKTDRAMALIIHSRHPGGLTDFELADLMGRQQTSAGKRRGELRDMGYIEKTEIRAPAPSGCQAIVWRINEDGRRMAATLLNREDVR